MCGIRSLKRWVGFGEWKSVSGITDARTPWLAFSFRGRYAGDVGAVDTPPATSTASWGTQNLKCLRTASWKGEEDSRSSVRDPFAETVGRVWGKWRNVSGITDARAPWLAFSSRGRYAGGVLRRPGDHILKYDDESYL